MPPEQRSLVRGIARDAWGDVWRWPLMWVLLALASVPLVFLVNFYLPSLFGVAAFSQTTYMVLQLAGYSVCFVLFFLFWCMAVFFYDDGVRGRGQLSYGGAFARMRGWALPSLRAGALAGLVRIFAIMAAQIVLSMAMSFLVSGSTTETSLQVLYYLYFYLNFIVADLVIVLVVLVPQMLCLERGRKVEEVFRASFRLVRERYRDALILLVVPELVAGTFYLGAAVLAGNLSLGQSITPVLLFFVAVLEGGRTAFLAAAFNRFYYHILEEEKKKRKKPRSAPQSAAKKPVKKEAAGGKASGKKPAGKPGKKR